MTPILNNHIYAFNKHNKPLISIIGASGTGKSLLAQRISLMITRSETAPNVLLVDADIYNRGMTIQFEEAIAKSKCNYLYDAIIGKNPQLEPIEITEYLLRPRKDLSLLSEGHIFFLPSIHKKAPNPYLTIASLKISDLQNLFFEAIDTAANLCNAKAIIIDTTPIPEKCGAICAANSDLLIAVGKKDKGIEIMDAHIVRLTEIIPHNDQVTIEKICNCVENYSGRYLLSEKAEFISNFHPIPALDGIQKINNEVDAESVIDAIDFDRHIVGILDRAFQTTHAELIPPWYAPLLPEWRNLAKVYGKSKPKIFALFLKQFLIATVMGLSSLICIILASCIGNFYSNSSMNNLFLVGIGMSVGLFSMSLSLFLGTQVLMDIKTCYAAEVCLSKEDVVEILKYLKLTPQKAYSTPPLKRKQHAIRKLLLLRKNFDVIWRWVIRNK